MGRGGGADRFLFDVAAHLIGDVVAGDNGERDDGNGRGGDEGEKELAVEAGAHLAQQRTRAGGAPRHGAENRGEHNQREERERADDGQLRQVHHVAEQRHDREAERVDAAAIAEQVDVVRLIVASEPRPDRHTG